MLQLGSALAGCRRKPRGPWCYWLWRCPRLSRRRRCRGQVRSEAVFEGFRTARGICRSLRIYYGDRSRAAAMDRLYGGFVRRGDRVFDIGAHVGDRVASFRRLGARVVAVEPQPAMVKVLKLFYGRRADVAIASVAVGPPLPPTTLIIHPPNPP